MSDLPADWAIEKAGEGLGYTVSEIKGTYGPTRQLLIRFARYIEAHEPAPVDRKLKCAREARARGRYCSESSQRYWRSGEWDDQLESHLQAITLYEEGFGNDPLS